MNREFAVPKIAEQVQSNSLASRNMNKDKALAIKRYDIQILNYLNNLK